MSSGQSSSGSFQNPGDFRGGLVPQASPIENRGQLAGTIINYAGKEPVTFRSNIPSRRNLPFVGREGVLESIRAALADPSSGRVVVLHGPPGVGKSELAREYARRNCETYTGGTFIVEAGRRAIVVDLARLGQTLLGLDYPPGMALEDQCLRALSALGIAPRLLIYDNVQAEDAVVPWLPPSGVPCDVLISTLAN
jgi:AAA ATPase domain